MGMQQQIRLCVINLQDLQLVVGSMPVQSILLSKSWCRGFIPSLADSMVYWLKKLPCPYVQKSIMNKTTFKLYFFSLCLSLPLLLIGSCMKFRGLIWPNTLLAIGILSTLTFLLIALYHVAVSRVFAVKVIWLLAFCTVPWVAGFLLYFDERRSASR